MYMILLQANCVTEVCENTCCNIYTILQILISTFLSITFLQSSIDKITDRKGNVDFIKKHFEKSILKNQAVLLLSLITILELAAGTISTAGIAVLLINGCNYWIFWGTLLSSISLLCLFAGQRLAKDYAGAQSLISYFIITLIGLYFCM